MNETEAAKLFNEELDALLSGGGLPAAPSDPGALALAGALARADYSGESAVRESLRERLVGRPAGFLAALSALFSSNYARAAFAAAVVIVALLPLARRQPAPPAAVPVRTAAVPVQAAAAPATAAAELPPPPKALARRTAAPSAAAGLFAALPAPRLESQRLSEFPIAPAGSGLPMTLAEGRRIPPAAAGEPRKLETESAPFPIESRPVRPDEIFERRTL